MKKIKIFIVFIICIVVYLSFSNFQYRFNPLLGENIPRKFIPDTNIYKSSGIIINKEFVPLLGNDEKNLAQIKIGVIQLYNNLLNNKTVFTNNTEKDDSINFEWTTKKNMQDFEWLDNLYEKDEKLQKDVDQYNFISDSIMQNYQNLEIIEGQIKLFNEEISNISERLQDLRDHRYNTIPNEERSKLDKIPLNIILVGRISIPKGFEPSDLQRPLTEYGFQKVYELTSSTPSYQNLIYKNEKGENFIYEEMAYKPCYIKVQDTYSKRLLKVDMDGNTYLYQIVRVEVFFTEEREQVEEPPSKNDTLNFKIDLFKIQDDSVLVFLTDPTKRIFFKKIKFGEDEKKGIKNLRKINDTLNAMNSQKISATKSLYAKKDSIDSVAIFIAKNDSILFTNKCINATIEKNRILGTISSQKKRRSEMDSIINIKYNNYTHYYENKKTTINKIWTDYVSKEAETQLEDMAMAMTDAVRIEVFAMNTNTRISRIVKENDRSIRIETNNVFFSPKISAYKILSLRIIEKGDEQKILLNIGFEIDWHVAESLSFKCEPHFLIDKINQLAWQPFPDPYADPSPTTWPNYILQLYTYKEKFRDLRLPNINELILLFDALKHDKRTSGKSPLVNNCFDWSKYLDYVIISDPKLSENNDSTDGIKIIDNNLNYKVIKINEIDLKGEIGIFLINTQFFKK